MEEEKGREEKKKKEKKKKREEKEEKEKKEQEKRKKKEEEEKGKKKKEKKKEERKEKVEKEKVVKKGRRKKKITKERKKGEKEKKEGSWVDQFRKMREIKNLKEPIEKEWGVSFQNKDRNCKIKNYKKKSVGVTRCSVGKCKEHCGDINNNCKYQKHRYCPKKKKEAMLKTIDRVRLTLKDLVEARRSSREEVGSLREQGKKLKKLRDDLNTIERKRTKEKENRERERSSKKTGRAGETRRKVEGKNIKDTTKVKRGRKGRRKEGREEG